MNFCGTRITTEPAVEKTTRKEAGLLQITEGMWKCEKEAIRKHNEQIELKNRGATLSTLKTMDMSFLGKLDKNKNFVFGVFPTTSFDCKLDITLNDSGTLSTMSCGGLPKLIGDGYRTGLRGKKLHTGYRHYILSANFAGMLPQKTKDKIMALRAAGISTYLVADTHWKTTEAKAPNPDPLLIAPFEGKVYLVDVFDASIEENYVASEFTEKQEEIEG